jgi:hypothetical protein
VQVGGGDVLGDLGDRSQWAQYSPGDDPAECDRHGAHDGERDAGLDEELVHLVRVLRSRQLLRLADDCQRLRGRDAPRSGAIVGL